MFLTAILLAGTIGFINGWMLFQANKKIWNKEYIKWSAYCLPFLLFVFGFFWWIGTASNIWFIRIIAASAFSFSFVLHILFLITLPFSLGAKGVSNLWADSNSELPSGVLQPSRRLFLKSAAAAFPVFAIGTAGSGFSSAFSKTQFPQINMPFTGLPKALNDFKILQLTDLHLGYYFGLDHLEETLKDAEKYNVDMVVVTGDIADDLTLMTDALKLIDQLKTPYQKYVTLGNHEYFRGIENSIKQIEAGPIPLLRNESGVLNINGSSLIIGGADDPVRLRGNKTDFFTKALDITFTNAPSEGFRLLLSHRPNALDAAEQYNIDLILSGHTHGGQVGISGKSLWDIFNENAYLWGKYQKGDSKLYTSAGMGHWFPFRLNCPLEAPVITLQKIS